MTDELDEMAEEHGEAGGSAPPRGPVRSCIGCGARLPLRAPEAADLVRLVLGPGGEIAVDAAGGAFGRGAHLHARPACVEKALRGLGRAYKGAARTVDGEPLSSAGLARAIGEAYERRAGSLLISAGRSRKVAVGADAVTEALRAGSAALVVVASDAAAAADLSEVRRAIASGDAVSFGNKASLGRLLRPGRATQGGEVAVAALLDGRIAEALRAAVAIADGVRGAGQSRGGRGGRGEGAPSPGRTKGAASPPAGRPGGASAIGPHADPQVGSDVDTVSAAANSGYPSGVASGGRVTEPRRPTRSGAQARRRPGRGLESEMSAGGPERARRRGLDSLITERGA